MKRPHIQICSENKLNELRQHLDQHLPAFKAIDGVVGITLNGGMSRGYADHLSEVDVTFYLTSEAYLGWQNRKTPLAIGISVLDGQLYDIKVCDYEAELKQEWEQVALWDTSYAEILFDPDGKIQRMFKAKLSTKIDPVNAGGLLFQCFWYSDLAGVIWVHRGDAVQGHQMLNQAVDRLVQALFIANREFIPHEKWLLHMSRTLEWQPKNWEKRLREAMSTGEMSIQSLQLRIDIVRSLREEVEVYLHSTYFPDLPVELSMKWHYELLSTLVQKQRLTLQEWQEMTGGNFLNGDPFFPIIRVVDDHVVLDRQAFESIRETDMYTWHYSILKTVRGY